MAVVLFGFLLIGKKGAFMKRVVAVLLALALTSCLLGCGAEKKDDNNVFDYYETWQEDEYPETYSGSASLIKCE